MEQIKYQIIKVKISKAGESVKFSADTNKLYKNLTGIFASLPFESSLFGTTLSLKVADREIFPEEWEIKLISTGQQVSPNDRFFNRIKEEAAGNRIDGRLTDGGVDIGVIFPYTAKIYLRLEEKL